MKRFWWLLAVPYVVVTSSANYYLPDGTIDFGGGDYYIIETADHHARAEAVIDKDVAADIAESLNEAHERRTHPPREHVSDSGTYPCCEDEHTGFMCAICDGQRYP